MKIIEVTNLKEATKYAVEIVLNESSKYDSTFNIALTGGHFGTSFTKRLALENIDYKKWQIFQTDERFVTSSEKFSIQRMIINKLFGENEQYIKSANFFNLNNGLMNAISEMSKLLDKKNIKKFDLTLLSLGEDGHLAGDFPQSFFSSDKRICWTKQANKLPRERISFSAKWLSSSNLVIVCVVGKKKEESYLSWMNGSGFHSEIIQASDNFIILKDKKIKKNNKIQE